MLYQCLSLTIVYPLVILPLLYLHHAYSDLKLVSVLFFMWLHVVPVCAETLTLDLLTRKHFI